MSETKDKLLAALCLLILIAGCQSPRDQMDAFVAKYNGEPVTVKYGWQIKPVAPYTAFTEPPAIYIDTHWLHRYEHMHATILKHEAYHVMTDGTHCEKRTCLMYKEFHAIADMFGKRPCEDCKSKLRNRKTHPQR